MNPINKLHIELSDQLNKVNAITFTCVESNIDLLNEAGSYFFKSGGKRLRPILTLICCNMLKYQKDDIHLKLASAIELIHAATLLHDDVIDGSRMRRFKKTVNDIWDNKTSILIGDLLLSHAFKLMIESKSFQVLECLSDVVSQMIMGELQQLEYAKSSIMISRSQYYDIIGKKTAHLFAAACKIAGIITQQNENILELLCDFGSQLGLLFQITDDVLDYKVNSGIGKNVGDDFLEGKVTLPIILLLENANEHQKTHIINLFSKDERSPEEFNEILKLVDQYEVHGKIFDIIAPIEKNIYSLLEKINVDDNTQKSHLYDITSYCVGRIL